MSVRVLIADDHALLRGALCQLLRDSVGVTDIQQAATLDDVYAILATDVAFDLLIVDLIMPGVESIDSIAALLQIVPNAKIVVMSAIDDRAQAIATLAAGLHGFIPKSLTAAQIALALSDVLAGRLFAPALLARQLDVLPHHKLSWPADMALLTKRQQDVLDQVLSGQSNGQIARALGIAVRTVKIHLSAIYRSAGVTTRSQLIVKLAREATGPDNPAHRSAPDRAPPTSH